MAHIAAAVVRDVLGNLVRFVIDPVRVHWALPATLAIIGVVVLYPYDMAISRAARSIGLGGDIRREVEAWQQYGQLVSMLFVAALIVLLDGKRWRRLLDMAAAAVCSGIVLNLMKMFIGRPRPKFDDAHTVLWPTGMYPIPGPNHTEVMAHAYDLGKGISSDLWSMPSSHTAYAMVLSLFLVAMYPRLRWLAWGMVVFVGLARVATGAHWATDVIVGAAVGYIIARPAIRGYWGVRFVDWFWLRFVDPRATRALPSVLAGERAAGLAG